MRPHLCMHSYRIKIEMCNACIYLYSTGMARLHAKSHLSKTISRRRRTHAENHHRMGLFAENHFPKTIFRRTRIHAENPHRVRLFSYPFNTSPVLSTGEYKIQPEMVAFCCGGFVNKKVFLVSRRGLEKYL